MKYSNAYISHINELKNLNKILNFHFKTRLLHWDVNNENLHGDWYERNTTDPDITPKMFQWIHAQEPDTQLFLNDYSAIPQPSITTVSDPKHCIMNTLSLVLVDLSSRFFPLVALLWVNI